MTIENTKNQFLLCKSRKDIAALLNISDESLRYFLYGIGTKNLYKQFKIPKKNGSERNISAPDKRLKLIQRKLADILLEVYQPKPAAHGFLKEKNIITNANMHVNKKVVLNIDLKNFYDQIHFGRVKGMFVNKPYLLGEEASLVLAQICCLDGKLPQGAPSSPIVTNMICAPLDTSLTKFAKKYHLIYSRYADDITFSYHHAQFPSEVLEKGESEINLSNELKSIIKEHNFEINYEKLRVFNNNKRQVVTGLVTNEFVNVNREYIKNLRAILHKCDKEGIYSTAKSYAAKQVYLSKNVKNILNSNERTVEEWFIKVLEGKINYLKQVRGENNRQFILYASELNRICQREIFKLTSFSILNRIENSVYIIEAINTTSQGTCFALKDYGIITNHHVVSDNDFYTIKTYKNETISSCVSLDVNSVHSNEDIDYIYFDLDNDNQYSWEKGDSSLLKLGDTVNLVSFPQYSKGNSPEIQKAKITSERNFHGQRIFAVDKRIVHGASGGLVLDQNNEKVVGLIRCGSESELESDRNSAHGFIPLNIILQDIEDQ